ncbi:hypothetical protein SLEP1_g26222 [Rubroshorea leprosula]|uniref:4-hydroxyphenylpyruvate dioxygenase n=1 Tax=Rubroshorea leprosula TaxID=152421 RepID=A0AAV5JRT7_9ROSI|nr:hypothetical protein SLEP1_g26222 [Rubroshorea leprosula]
MGKGSSVDGFKLVGFSKFVRTNPKSDKFKVKKFHHVEFWCSDATNTARRFSWGLGMQMVAKSDLSTGTMTHASYLISSVDLNFLFTAPSSPTIAEAEKFSHKKTACIPTFDHAACRLSPPHMALTSEHSQLRSTTPRLPSPPALPTAQSHLPPPRCSAITEENLSFPLDYGIWQLDHAVGNVLALGPAVSYLIAFTGFHEFAEFTAEDVGTSESGVNTVALANNDEMVLLSLNEPVFGTKGRARTLKEMRKRSWVGGFELMQSPPPTYYNNLKNRPGDVLNDKLIKQCEELGISVDRDDQGTLLQIFTKPVGDRSLALNDIVEMEWFSNHVKDLKMNNLKSWPTIFLEIIQRIGCMVKDEEGKVYQKGGCGGFGKGNFSELFKSIGKYEKTLEARRTA